MVIIESVKPTKIEEKKETILLKMIEQPTDKQDGEREKQNNEESKEEYKNEMKEKETENTKVKAKEVCDSMKEDLDMVMIEFNRIEESVKQSFVRAYQEYKKVYYCAGLCYRGLGDFENASKTFRKLLKLEEERENIAEECAHNLTQINLQLINKIEARALEDKLHQSTVEGDKELTSIKNKLKLEEERANIAEKSVHNLTQINLQLINKIEGLESEAEEFQRQVLVSSEDLTYT